MSFSLYQLILILGITQGVLTSVLMLKSQQFQPHQRLLGGVVLVFVTVNLRAAFLSMGMMDHPSIRYMPLGLELFLPPLMYVYVCSITRFKSVQKSNRRIHWLLPSVWLVYDLLLYIMTLFEPTVIEQQTLAERWHYGAVNGIEDHLILLSTWFYLIIGTLRYRAFTQASSSMAVKQRSVLRRWLKQILGWMSIVAVFLSVNQVLDQLDLVQTSKLIRWQAFNVFLAFTSYYLGFLGYRLQSPRLFEAINALKSHEIKNQASDGDQLEQKLNHLMQQQTIYLDPDISIKQVAASLDVSAEKLSFILNQKLQISFRDLINQHRIAAVKLAIEQQPMTNASILDLALNSGFNSQASFYRAFKKFVGMTPLQYNQQHKS